MFLKPMPETDTTARTWSETMLYNKLNQRPLSNSVNMILKMTTYMDSTNQRYKIYSENGRFHGKLVITFYYVWYLENRMHTFGWWWVSSQEQKDKGHFYTMLSTLSVELW